MNKKIQWNVDGFDFTKKSFEEIYDKFLRKAFRRHPQIQKLVSPGDDLVLDKCSMTTVVDRDGMTYPAAVLVIDTRNLGVVGARFPEYCKTMIVTPFSVYMIDSENAVEFHFNPQEIVDSSHNDYELTTALRRNMIAEYGEEYKLRCVEHFIPKTTESALVESEVRKLLTGVPFKIQDDDFLM